MISILLCIKSCEEKEHRESIMEVFYTPGSEMLYITTIYLMSYNSITWLYISVRQSGQCHLTVYPGRGRKAFVDHLEFFAIANTLSIRTSSKIVFIDNLTRS